MLSVMEGSPVKKTLLLVVISSLAVLMLLPVSGSVNTTGGKLQVNSVTLSADGSPIPPYPPQATAPVVVADGSPIPPYPPQRTTATPVVIADGSPIPPYPPQKTVSSVIVADGSPIPPYPPQFSVAATNA